jgi:3-oxosteroid 1-dehydrogenase
MGANGVSTYDHEFDLVVVGSGAGAMTAAIRAHDLGARVVVLEKTPLYGGNSAMSGGSIWIPNNSLMKAAGVDDSRADALTYLKHVTRGEVPDSLLETYVDHAPQMLEYMLEKTHLRMECMLTYMDYYAEAPGGKPGGRSLEASHFDASRLGDEFEKMREPALQELVFGRMSMTATEAHHLLARHPGWVGLTTKIMMRYWLDVAWRTRTKRDRTLSLGNALIAPLRLSLMERKIPLWLETAVDALIADNERVDGVVASRHGRKLRIRGRRGVLLAAGGFESNPEMRAKYLPSPTRVEWTTGSPASTGDAIRMGMELGADVGWMHEAWWGPTTVVPGEERARMLVIEKGLPGCILVNKKGRRFVNEASPYANVVQVMYAKNTPDAPTVPSYMVFDGQYRQKYPCGPFLQGSQQPDWSLPKKLRDGYLKCDETLPGLARKLGIDPEGLVDQVRRFNENARAGHDPEFHRGEGGFDRYYGDEKVKPNPCLAPLEKPPFYGIEAYPGELGTKGGLKTDTRARVLKRDGSAIAGLYAIGNCSASVMGPTYPGAGGTIGPAMTFGFLAAQDAVSEMRVAAGTPQVPASELVR